jgi:hypothetical protein
VPFSAVYSEAVPGGRDAGESFLIATSLRLDLAQKATLIARIATIDPRKTVLDFEQAGRTRGGALIKRVVVTSSFQGLFDQTGEVNLAKIDAQGRLVSSDASMLAQALQMEGISMPSADLLWAPAAGATLEDLIPEPPAK